MNEDEVIHPFRRTLDGLKGETLFQCATRCSSALLTYGEYCGVSAKSRIDPVSHRVYTVLIELRWQELKVQRAAFDLEFWQTELFRSGGDAIAATA